MNFLDMLSRTFRAATPAAPKPGKGGSDSSGAGTTLLTPQPPIPKGLKKGQQTIPSWATSATPTTAAIQLTDLLATNVDIVSTYRTGQDTYTVIRNLARLSPDLAAAVSAYLRVGIPEKYIALARNGDGSVNDNATRLAMQILRQFDKMPDYTNGFSNTDSVRSCSEALAKELILYGAAAMELVLDKTQMPIEFAPVSVTKLKLYQDGDGVRPTQYIAGIEIDLDIPTFFYVALDASLLDPYPQSPLESAIQPVLAAQQMQNDLRKMCSRSAFPRLDVSIEWDKLHALLPQDILGDPEKEAAFYKQSSAQVQDMINSIGVEDALVHFDFVKVAYLSEDGNMPTVFDTLVDIFNSKVATGARTLPAILGHGAGSQNVASTETMLFMLSANSMVRLKLQEMYSRAMTLAVRLFGLDVVVEVEFDPINLRPEMELEAFRQMKSDRLLRLLSLGMISDMECCIRLTGNPPGPDYVPLSGTGFADAISLGVANNNPYSGSPEGGDSTGGTVQQKTKSPAPAAPKGGKGK